MNSKKMIASVIALAMAVLAVAGNASAATAEELANQIAQLQAQLSGLTSQLGGDTAVTTGTTSSTAPAACAGISFTRNLTLGSQGTDVKCLQALLNQDPTTQVAASGVGSAGNETMYFGGLTKTAVVAFQNKYAAEILAPVGLTSGTGFVGASTRVKLNAMLVSTTTTTTTTTGDNDTDDTTTTTTGTTGTGLNMTGAEGAITVSLNPTPADGSKIYEGDSKVAIFGMKVKATGSDADVQRVTLQFSAQPYSYFSTIYLYDGDTEITSAALNSTSVSKVSSTDYEITLSGFASKVIVSKDTTKVLTVKADVLGGISSSLVTSASPATIYVGTPSTTSVRAVDQAGLNQYGGVDMVCTSSSSCTSGTGRSISINASQSASATLTLSTNANTPKARNVIADSSNQFDKITLLSFDLKGTKDTLLIDQINNVMIANDDKVPSSTAYAATGSATASTTFEYELPTTVYLVDDTGTVIGTASPAESTGGTTDIYQVDFTDLNYTLAKDTTKTFTIKIDDTITPSTTNGATSSVDGIGRYKVGVYGSQMVVEKSNGATLTPTGLAVSNDAIPYVQGPVFTLASITTSNTQAPYSGASSTLTATFNVQIAATTGDVFIPDSNAFAMTYGFNGTDTAPISGETYTHPSGTIDGTYSNKIPSGTSVTYAVSGTTQNLSGAGTYDIRLFSVKWGHIDDAAASTAWVTSDYMIGSSDWISPAVYLR